jgi:hypothetical protein
MVVHTTQEAELGPLFKVSWGKKKKKKLASFLWKNKPGGRVYL